MVEAYIDRAASTILLSILILNWNRASDTRALVDNLATGLKTTDATDVEIIVLDNGSGEPLDLESSEYEANLQVLRSDENLGYSGGMSFLASVASGKIFWFLNNDVRMEPASLTAALLAANRADGTIKLPLVYNPDGSVQSRDCTWSGPMGWRSGQPPLRTIGTPYRLFGDIFVGPLMARATYDKIGAFPQVFHTYAEDLDACYAAAMMDIPVVRDPSIRLTHAKSSSRPQEKDASFAFDRQMVRNAITSALINYRKSNYWAVVPLGVKLMFHELLWRRRIPRTRSALVAWFTIPLDAWRTARSLEGLRGQRQAMRSRADRHVWSVTARDQQ